MKSLFKKVEIFSTSILGKQDKREFSKNLGRLILDKKKEYKIIKCKNRTTLIDDGRHVIFFEFLNAFIPTIRYLEENVYELPVVYVDSGAVEPVKRGANIMAPGIYKYIEMIVKGFERNDIVIVKIIDGRILGIGKTLISKCEIDDKSEGEAIDVYHHIGDALYIDY